MRYIEIGGVYKDINSFGRGLYIDPIEVDSIRNRFNNTDVYCTVYSYEENKIQDESNLFGPFYLDLDMDFKNDIEYKRLIRDLKIIVTSLHMDYGIDKEFINFFFTGKKGFHLIINPLLFGIKPCNKLNVYYKEIAKDLNNKTVHKVVDTRIYDNKRLFRLPNSINSKSGLYKVPISYEDLCKLSYEEIKKYASSPKVININNNITKIEKAYNKFNEIKKRIEFEEEIKNTRVFDKQIDISEIKLPKCMINVINNGSNKGQRNNTAVILASAFFQRGVNFEQTMQLINEWNELKNVPSLPYKELETTVLSAYSMAQVGKGYGCTSIKDLGLCTENCRLNKIGE